MKKTIFLILSVMFTSLFSASHATEYQGYQGVATVNVMTYNRACFTPNWCQIADAGFSTSNPDDWYTIAVQPYPTFVPLSLFRNRGTVQGNFQLTPTGLIIGQAGNYAVNFTAILSNPDGDADPLVVINLVKNGIFNPLDTNTIGGVGVVPFQSIVTIQASGVLQNVLPGTALSLVISNGSGANSDIQVVAWSISVFRIPCDPIP